MATADKHPETWPWELYDLSKDWTQYNDVAAQYPEKVKELEKLFWEEAERNQVLPMDTTTFTRSILPRPNLTAGRTVFTYSGEVTGTPNGNAPNVLASSYNIKAEVEIPEGGAEGMLVTHGGRFAGYGFYLLKGKPVYTWNLFGLKRIKWEGPDALAPGKHTLEFDFKYDGLGAGTLQYGSPSGLGRSGTGYLKVDGKVVATQKMEKTVPHAPAVGRELRRGCRYRLAGSRRGLSDALPLYRQAPQADPDHRPAEALPGRHREAQDGHARQSGERVVALISGTGPRAPRS